MEQSRIANQQSAQGTHAAVRTKGVAKPAQDASQDPAASGGFMALMAALGDGLPTDEAAPASGVDALIDPSSAVAGQMYDPAVRPDMQGFFASALGGAAATAGGLQAAVGQGGIDGLAGGSRVSWALDPLGGGLVAQTAALDGQGDVKDGDAAAGLLAQGRPTVSRGTASWAQRNEALGALAGSLVGSLAGKSLAPELGTSAKVAADAAMALPGAPASASPARESGAVPGGREGVGGRESLGLAGLDSTAVLAAQAGVGTEGWQRDFSEVGATSHRGDGAWDASALEPGAVQTDGAATAAGAADAPLPPGAEDALAEQVTYWVNQKTQNAEMTLTRDGQPVEVSVSLSGNEAHVTFRSDQEHTRQMLDGSMAQLSDMLRDQGLILSGASVGTSARDGQSANGEASPDRGSRKAQAAVVAAEGVAERPSTRLDGHRTLDVFA